MTTPPAAASSTAQPVAEAVIPAALPQSKPVEIVPASAPDGQTAPAMSKAGGGGCNHQTQVYLTN